MGFFNRLFGNKTTGPYRSDAAFAKNRAGQLTMMPETVAQLRQHGVTEDSVRRVEFFFYTNTLVKAGNLSHELNDLGYASNSLDSAGTQNEYCVNGWTTPLKINEQSMTDWISQMCDRGARHDCEFDGWGMNLSEEHVD